MSLQIIYRALMAAMFITVSLGKVQADLVTFGPETFSPAPSSTEGNTGTGTVMGTNTAGLLGFWQPNTGNANGISSFGSDAWNFAAVTVGNGQHRTSGLLLDLNGLDAGTSTAKFDVSNFVAGTSTSASSNFQVWQFSGLGTVASGNTVTVDFGDGNSNNQLDVTTQGASSVSLLSQQLITGNQLGFSLDFTTTSASASSYLYLTWNNTKNGTGLTGNAFSVDNLSVTAVPEPSSIVLMGIGAIGMVFHRKRRAKSHPTVVA